MTRCVDEESNDVEPGQPGELIVKGDVVTNGYYNNPKATEECFHDGWFYTGDIAVERNGKFYIVDRKKVRVIQHSLSPRLTISTRKSSNTKGFKLHPPRSRHFSTLILSFKKLL